jgi:hypothetical protein
MATDEDLLKSLLQKIYNVVVGPDPINNQPTVGGSYVSFCLPGIASWRLRANLKSRET